MSKVDPFAYAPPFIGRNMKFSWIWGPTHFRVKRDLSIAMSGPALKKPSTTPGMIVLVVTVLMSSN